MITRTKSARNIYDQYDRIFDTMCEKSWNGTEYVGHAELISRLEKLRSVCNNYVNNIYTHFGAKDMYSCTSIVANAMFEKQVQTYVYMGKQA